MLRQPLYCAAGTAFSQPGVGLRPPPPAHSPKARQGGHRTQSNLGVESELDQGHGQLLVPDRGHRPALTKDRRLRGAAQATSQDVKDVFDKALANEGLLAIDSPMPKSLSDRGPQMRSKSIRRFLVDLGITQLFARPHTPADNAEIESFFATIKGERLYKMSYDDPIQMINDVDGFVVFYNDEGLHQGIGFVYHRRETRRHLGGDH